MSRKSLFAIIVSLLLIGATVVVWITQFQPAHPVEEPEQSNNEPPIQLGNIVSFDDAVNSFSFDLFKKFLTDPQQQGNVFTSPYSIFTALAMTYEGANGTTADEMKNVLNIEQTNASFHEYMQALYRYLNQKKEYNISTANALWIKENYPLLKEYKDLILTYYGGTSTGMDYSDPEEAAAIINGWIENNTNHLIKNLISSGDIDPVFTRLILTNAIYFKGIWQVQFDEQNTTPRPFEVGGEGTVEVDTMRLTGTQDFFNYTDNDLMQILELPYSGNDIAMVICLPKEGHSIDDMISSLDCTRYQALIESMNQTMVDIYLPKFAIKTPLYSLKQYLIDLGMPTAFTSEADFSKMTGFRELSISQVLHKAFIEVNEEGTEAAAATGITMVTSVDGNQNHSHRIVFDANHPFLFLIQQKITGTILFMGTVVNPSL
jgi:serpin B